MRSLNQPLFVERSGRLLDEGNPSMVAPRRKQCVCRIHRRVPGDGGVYYLRALLGAKPGRAYSDLMTVTAPDGSVQRLDTFQAAAAALGIVYRDLAIPT